MNILIVDDQPNILSSLVTSIRWRDLGITGVYTAASALAARSILTDTSMDILLTDIEMPVENGISLLSWVREQGIELECIFLTSHTDFYYARQAIGLGAVDYVVQPARHEDIVRAVENAKLRILQKRKTNELIKTSKFASASQNTMLKEYWENWPDPAMEPEAVEKKLTQLRDFGINCRQDQPILLLHAHITRWMRLPQKAVDFLRQYETALDSVFAYLQVETMSYFQKDTHFVTVLFCELTDELRTHAELFQKFAREQLGCRMNLCLCSTIISRVSEAILKINETVAAMEPSQSSDEEDYMEIIQYQDQKPSEIPDRHEQYFHQIKKFIRANMSRSITRMDIASELYLSPDYVNSIVKGCTGLTCKEFITHEKMAGAKKLLETTQLPVGEIARRLGYDSFAYFSKVYKDTYHMTPRLTRKG